MTNKVWVKSNFCLILPRYTIYCSDLQNSKKNQVKPGHYLYSLSFYLLPILAHIGVFTHSFLPYKYILFSYPSGRDELYLGKPSRRCFASCIWWWISWHGTSYQQQVIVLMKRNPTRTFPMQHVWSVYMFGIKNAGFGLASCRSRFLTLAFRG